MSRRAVHVAITGLVQAVGYRAWVEREAQSRGVSGWVRNRRDGSVEALVSGPPASVDGFVEWARKGPSGARVDRVDVAADEIQGPGPFSVRPTA
jgi:acylphosphatase